ncbi:MAG: efflux RND transporter periplasmic adaptor subunit [bacterium]|nr:efflux RND transporter periplasmic adaptor subunit [bacterium]
MKRFSAWVSGLSAWVLQPLLILAILAVGFVAAMGLSTGRETPQRSDDVRYAPLVRTATAVQNTVPVVVRGNGTLQPRTRIDLVAQVGGEVIEVHPGYRAGGHFAAGETLVRIEPLDYELAVSQAKAEVSAASSALVTTTAESDAAREEWDELHSGEPCPPLVALEPQIAEAKARFDAAEAMLDSAELDLERTRIALPFAGRVVDAAVDVGQVVPANQSLGVVYATERFEVPVPLRIEELRWLRLPEAGARDAEVTGSAALVRAEAGGETVEIEGRVLRLEGELAGTSRMVRVVVDVPMGGVDARLAARVLPGAFVDVELDGGTLTDAIELPRAALREEGAVWVVDGGRLRVAHPKLVRTTNEAVFVRGLTPGTLVVTSQLEIVTDGMEIRTAVDEGSR